jgi:prolyl oligopeptidase
MSKGIFLAVLPLLAAGWTTACSVAPRAPRGAPMDHRPASKIVYPPAQRVDQADDFHGVRVADPYRWLEDLDSEGTRHWVEEENQVTHAYLEHLPDRDALRARLTELWNFERFGVPTKHGSRYFFTRNDGLQNQSVHYWLDRLDGEPKVLLDPNGLSADGTVAVSGVSVSKDGRRMAYGLSSGGSDWQEWKVREVDTGKDLPDDLRWVKFSSAAWTPDGAGFYYSRYDEPRAGGQMEDANYFQKLYYHQVGTPQSADRLIYHRPDRKELGFLPIVTDDGRYLVIHIWKGTEVANGVAYQDLSRPGSPVVDLLGDFDASYGFVGNDGPILWFQTDLGAPRSRLIAIDLRDPARERWQELIPEGAEPLQGVTCVGDTFLAVYLKDAHSQVRQLALDGRPLRGLELPGLGSVRGFTGERGDRETFFAFSSYTAPGTVYRYDLTSGALSVFREPHIRGYDATQFESRQVFFTSRDGTRVPMFLTYRKGLKLDGQNPVFLYGYGGFNISLTPTFSVEQVAWMERGGVYAVVNLRGGGEYGEDWHRAGMKLKKQNVFDDFIAAGEWLIANHYTAREHLGIVGFSNGGLLTAASMVQRPDLFGAVVVGVGVLDMLRFHKFTIGWGWTSDYGSPDDPAEFKALLAYSPYHNLKPGTVYPPTLITTADHDDRVVPAHSFKFAAALQNANGGPNPTLIRIETRAGHGGGKPVQKQIEESADTFAFLLRAIGRHGVEAAAVAGSAGR